MNHINPQLYLFEPSEFTGNQVHDAASELFDDHIATGQKAGRLKPRTVAEYRTTQRKFASWAAQYLRRLEWDAYRCITPIDILYNLNRADLDKCLDAVESDAIAAKEKNPGRTANKAREHLAAIINRLDKTADSVGKLPRIPEKRRQNSQRQKIILTPSEVGRLYTLAASLPIPPSWEHDPVTFGQQWQAAIVCFVSLGLDTGSIWPPVDRQTPTALRWHNYHPTPTPPTRNTEAQNANGWLIYTRQKNSKTCQRPLSPQLAWQLKNLSKIQPKAKPTDVIFWPWKYSKHWTPCDLFRKLCRAAEVTNAIDARTLDRVPWILQSLRKTAGTWANTAVPGSGSALLCHRSRELSSITESHYVDCSPLAARAILSTPMPREFPT